MNIKVNLEDIEVKTNICPTCLGTGKLKAMQSVATYGGGSIRGTDIQVKCGFCNGTGVIIRRG